MYSFWIFGSNNWYQSEMGKCGMNHVTFTIIFIYQTVLYKLKYKSGKQHIPNTHAVRESMRRISKQILSIFHSCLSKYSRACSTSSLETFNLNQWAFRPWDETQSNNIQYVQAELMAGIKPAALEVCGCSGTYRATILLGKSSWKYFGYTTEMHTK